MYMWLQNRAEAETDTGQTADSGTTKVAVASMDLPWGTKLTADSIALVVYPSGSLPKAHFTSVDSLAGRIALSNLNQNEVITENKLAPLSVTTGGVSAVTDKEKRAMAVKVDEVVGVAGFIKPGDRVDVLVTIARSSNQTDLVTKTVLGNILVLAAGATIELDEGDEKTKPKTVTVITLEVAPEEAEKLALASTKGKIRLALRNPLNTDPVVTKGITVAGMLDMKKKKKPRRTYKAAKSKKKPSKPPQPPTVKVEVIKGGTVTQKQF
jgi:pilus assembly protein CpaB